MTDEKTTAPEQSCETAPENPLRRTAATDQKKLNIYRAIAVAELLLILFLIIGRWIWSGWWIDWNKSGKHPGDKTNTQQQEFVAPEFDPAAKQGVPTVADDMGWSLLTIKEGFEIHVCGVLRADENGVVPLYLTSDAGNNVWVKIRLLDANDNNIGETGLLLPGEYVENVQLNDKAKSGEVKLQVMGYEPKTYYSAGTVALQTTLTMP